MSKSFLLFLLTFIAISCKAPEENIIHLGDDIIYVGVNDHKVDLFEGQYPVKNGISYNSYIVVDTKIMVFDLNSIILIYLKMFLTGLILYSYLCIYLHYKYILT